MKTIGLHVCWIGWYEWGVSLLLGLVASVSVFFVFLIWRKGYSRGWRAARAEQPKCLDCGYELSGLTHTRCPECGAEYPLDRLWRTPMLNPANLKKGKKQHE